MVARCSELLKMFWVVAKVFGIVAWCLGGCQGVAKEECFSTFLCIISTAVTFCL